MRHDYKDYASFFLFIYMTFMSKEFSRKSKEDKPVVAICYDFDKTLSPDDMQAQGYIQSVGYEVESFWKESNGLAEENDMDQNLAYMFTMIQKAHGKFVFNRKALMDYGAKVKLFPGVDTWFKRIREYGESKGVIVEHYIISSGLKEMIEGTKVADEFEKIYASSFYYDKGGVAQWPAQVINYTSKTQFLFRIEKEKLILDLENSNSFARTHFVISRLKAFNNWSDKERQQLKQIAEKNNQVSYRHCPKFSIAFTIVFLHYCWKMDAIKYLMGYTNVRTTWIHMFIVHDIK